MNDIKQLSQMKIGTFDCAYRKVIDRFIRNGYKIINVMPINNNRYIIIFTDKKNILVAYKREPFYNFSILFRKEGLKGVGESINAEDIDKALLYNVEEIYVTYPNGIVYNIGLEEFINQSKRWINKEGKDIYSISIHELKRAFEL